MTRTTDGTIITFDLQTSYEKRRISNRVVYYACREIATQKVERSAYEDLKNVVVTLEKDR